MNKRTELPTAENSSNFNRVAGATCQVGTTLENLKAAVCGETGASAKYAACAKLAKEKGYEQLGRLWEATSAAEQVHIRLEAGLVEELEPGYERPTADAPELEEIDLNLIASANGEIFETSDMYPGFIAKAQEEGNDKAVQVFTKAKLAEAVHAELYCRRTTTSTPPMTTPISCARAAATSRRVPPPPRSARSAALRPRCSSSSKLQANESQKPPTRAAFFVLLPHLQQHFAVERFHAGGSHASRFQLDEADRRREPAARAAAASPGR